MIIPEPGFNIIHYFSEFRFCGIVKPEKLYSVELQNITIELIYLSKGKDAIYKQALAQINDVIALIDEELN